MTHRSFSGNGRRARACRRFSFAANILATSGLTPSKASISPQDRTALEPRQESSCLALPVRAKFGRARDPCCVLFADKWQRDVHFAAREPARLHTGSPAPG